MRHRLFVRMLGVYLTIITLIVSSLALGLTYFLQRYYFGQKEQQLLREANEIGQLFISFNKGAIGRRELDRAVNALAEVSNTRVFLLNGDQDLINRTLQVDGQQHTPDGTLRADLQQLLAGQQISRRRQFSSTLNTEVAFVGQPLWDEQGKVQGVLLLYSPLSETTATLNYLYRIIWLITLGALVLGGVATFLVSKRISMPIVAMSKAFTALAKGKQQEYVSVGGKDEVAQLASAFNHMKDELAKTELIRRDFIAAVSHELRTPLTTIKGFIQAIHDGMVPKEQEAHYRAIVLSEAGRMTRLINDLMELVKMQAGVFKLELGCVDLKQVAQEVVLAHAAQAETKDIALMLQAAEAVCVWADRDRLKQILSNLITNSLRYTDRSGTITIKVSKQHDKGSLTVTDTGCGISAEELPYIFDKFYRVDKARELETGGSGLGLSIVKQLVELHQGRIWAESQPGQGTSITVSLKGCS